MGEQVLLGGLKVSQELGGLGVETLGAILFPAGGFVGGESVRVVASFVVQQEVGQTLVIEIGMEVGEFLAAVVAYDLTEPAVVIVQKAVVKSGVGIGGGRRRMGGVTLGVSGVGGRGSSTGRRWSGRASGGRVAGRGGEGLGGELDQLGDGLEFGEMLLDELGGELEFLPTVRLLQDTERCNGGAAIIGERLQSGAEAGKCSGSGC